MYVLFRENSLGKSKYGKYLFFTVFEGRGNYTLYDHNLYTKITLFLKEPNQVNNFQIHV